MTIMPIFDEQFRALLKNFRKKAGLSHKELGEKINRDASFISRLERGAREPPDRLIVFYLAKALSLDDGQINELLLAAGYVGYETEEYPSDLTIRSELKKDMYHLLQILTRVEKLLLGKYPKDLLVYWELLDKLGYPSWEDPQKQFKERIAKWVVENALNEKDTIFLDTGTTTTQIAHMIVESSPALSKIYTNNLIAAIRLITAGYSCALIGGDLNILSDWEPYSVEISGRQSRKMIKAISPTATILSTTSISFKKGPFAMSEQSIAFKRTLIKSASKLIIVADYTKFTRGVKGDKPILSESDWTQVRDNITTVITSAPEDEELYGKIFRNEINLFGDKLIMAQ